jgi:hypothetical protein
MTQLVIAKDWNDFPPAGRARDYGTNDPAISGTGAARQRFYHSGNKEVLMKKLAIGLLAAAGIAMSVPANAQGVWVGAGPVGVGVGVGPGYGYGYDRGYYGHGYGPGYRSYAYDGGYSRHCRVVRENFNGHIRKVRQCW